MSQNLKSSTAAQKLGILLSAAPEDFQQSTITRDELAELQDNPPQWLVDLRKNGPFPRDVIAAKLGVSTSALRREGLTEPLDADQVGELLANPPQWLEHERSVHRKVVAESERLKAEKAEKAEQEAKFERRR